MSVYPFRPTSATTTSRAVKLALSLAAAALAAFTLAPSALAAPGDTVRVSMSWEGGDAEGMSSEPSISADGRYVAFTSAASNVIPGDANKVPDIFVYDRQKETVELASPGEISAAEPGPGEIDGQANAPSGEPAISGDGRYVAFSSYASNLVPGDTNGRQDVYVYDRATRTVERVSVGKGGVQGNGISREPSISQDGRVVAFFSSSTKLVSGLTPVFPYQNIYVHERGAPGLELISVGEGSGGNAPSHTPSIDGAGDLVAFESQASNLSPQNTSGEENVYLFERPAQETKLVSVGEAGKGDEAANAGSSRPSISEDGNVVAFASEASNLVAGDTNSTSDVFAYERGNSSLELVSVGEEGEPASGPSSSGDTPAVSEDGRYVAFSSFASNLVERDFAPRGVFVRDRTEGRTTRESRGGGGDTQANGASSAPAISADGAAIGFESTASNLVPEDENGLADVFLHETGGPGPQPAEVVTLDAVDAGGTPATQSATAFGPVTLTTSADFSWDSSQPGLEPQGLTPWLVETVIQFDDDFTIDAEGLPVCMLESLFGTTTEEALEVCRGAVIGSGHFEGTVGAGPITLFNGAPDAGRPTVLVHIRYTSEFSGSEVTELRTGVFRPSSFGSDYGTELDIGTLALGLMHIDLSLEGEPVPGHVLVGGRCADPDHTWNFYSELIATYGLYIAPQVITKEVTLECSVDEDGNGIADELEPPAGEPGEFSDGEGTAGTLLDSGGLAIEVSDAPAPDGVRIKVGEGKGEASFQVCGFSTLTLTAGSEAIVTCGSVIVRVVQGEATVTVGDGSIVASVPTGGEAEVADNGDGTFTVDNLGDADVTVTIEGEEEIVGGGESTTVEEPLTTTPGHVTGGGQVATAEGNGRAVFGLEAKSDAKGLRGSCNLVDPSTETKLTCTDVTALSVDGSGATIAGDATVNGETTTYRIHVEDAGEPGAGQDTFTIHTASGYQVGGTLKAGNVQVH